MQNLLRELLRLAMHASVPNGATLHLRRDGGDYRDDKLRRRWSDALWHSRCRS